MLNVRILKVPLFFFKRSSMPHITHGTHFLKCHRQCHSGYFEPSFLSALLGYRLKLSFSINREASYSRKSNSLEVTISWWPVDSQALTSSISHQFLRLQPKPCSFIHFLPAMISLWDELYGKEIITTIHFISLFIEELKENWRGSNSAFMWANLKIGRGTMQPPETF